jgi:hypothetical protein
MEIANEIGADHMDEDVEDDEYDDDGGDATATLLLRHPVSLCHLLLLMR